MQRIHWMDLPGNKYLKKLEPDMLKNRCVVQQTIRQVGIKRKVAPETIEVFYDRDYVLARLEVDVISALDIDSLERLIALVTDAWNDNKLIEGAHFHDCKAG